MWEKFSCCTRPYKLSQVLEHGLLWNETFECDYNLIYVDICTYVYICIYTELCILSVHICISYYTYLCIYILEQEQHVLRCMYLVSQVITYLIMQILDGVFSYPESWF